VWFKRIRYEDHFPGRMAAPAAPVRPRGRRGPRRAPDLEGKCRRRTTLVLTDEIFLGLRELARTIEDGGGPGDISHAARQVLVRALARLSVKITPHPASSRRARVG